MDKYFRCIDKIIKMGKIPARIKFILKDVQDLRTNKWVPRLRPMMPCSPQLHTIDQVLLAFLYLFVGSWVLTRR